MTRAKALARIRDLWRLVHDAGATEHEAMAARRAALKLEAKHGAAELELEEAPPPPPPPPPRAAKRRAPPPKVVEVHHQGGRGRRTKPAPFWCFPCNQGRVGTRCPVCQGETRSVGGRW